MESEARIDFQHVDNVDEVRRTVTEHIAELERNYDRITSCRVAVKGPGPHHRVGTPYEVHIHLSLPEGREVNVTRTPPADQRHADLTFAIDDAFRHARRQLQDEVRVMDQRVKRLRPYAPPTGS